MLKVLLHSALIFITDQLSRLQQLATPKNFFRELQLILRHLQRRLARVINEDKVRCEFQNSQQPEPKSLFSAINEPPVDRRSQRLKCHRMQTLKRELNPKRYPGSLTSPSSSAAQIISSSSLASSARPFNSKSFTCTWAAKGELVQPISIKSEPESLFLAAFVLMQS